MTPVDVDAMLSDRGEKVFEAPDTRQRIFRLYGGATGIFYLVGATPQKKWGVSFDEDTTREEIEAEIAKGREFVN